jgi:hypothetical protein
MQTLENLGSRQLLITSEVHFLMKLFLFELLLLFFHVDYNHRISKRQRVHLRKVLTGQSDLISGHFVALFHACSEFCSILCVFLEVIVSICILLVVVALIFVVDLDLVLLAEQTPEEVPHSLSSV